MKRRSFAAGAFGVAALAFAGHSAAQEPEPGPIAFGADQVRFDGRSKSVEVTGNVRVDQPPFHFTSDALRLERTPIGVVLAGSGKVAFCPCLGAPLDVRFSGATIAPPHDVILRNPILEVFGVPVAWLPIVWLRSAGRPGLLPPEIAWHGADGLFAGGGVHAPWRAGDMDDGLDLRAGGYARGGVAVDAALRSPGTSTRVGWDRLRGRDGVIVGALGSFEPGGRGPDAAWEVDALRGPRAVVATTEIDAAARPFDRARGEMTWRGARGGGYGWTFASGVRAFAPRGGALGDLGAGGPIVTLGRADAIGRAGTYDVAVEGGAIAVSSSAAPIGSGGGVTTFARGAAGISLAVDSSYVRESVTLRAVGMAADDGVLRSAAGAAQARGALTLPLVRAYGSADASDPWVHRTEPRLEAAVLATAPATSLDAGAGGVIGLAAGRGATGPRGGAWMGGAGWSNAVARRGDRGGAEVDVAAGAVGDTALARFALRARATADARWLAVRADFARVLTAGRDAGGAFIAGARFGDRRGLHVALRAAERDGLDPLLARALVDPPLEPSAGFLAAAGWTGGARVELPLGSRLTARGGADVDLASGELVGAVGAIEIHDPCGCVVVRTTAQHRVGRPGMDVWVSVDLPLAAR